MNLNEYLTERGQAKQLAEAVGVDAAQVRQWQIAARDRSHKSARTPSPRYAHVIESATGGKVRRWDLRPTDWHQIWPDLVDAPGAPPVPMPKAPIRKSA